MTRRALAVAGVWTAAVLLAGGCGDGGSDPTSPTSPTSPTAPLAPTTPATSTSPPSDAHPAPSPDAASGREVATDGVSLRLPQTYRLLHEGPTRVNAQGRGVRLRELLAATSGPTLGVNHTLDQEAAEYLRAKQYLRRPERGPDVEIDGRAAFHFSGPIDSATWVEAFGGVTDAYYSAIEIRFPQDLPRAYRDRIVAQVLATVRFS